jgi:hypothetical protein
MSLGDDRRAFQHTASVTKQHCLEPIAVEFDFMYPAVASGCRVPRVVSPGSINFGEGSALGALEFGRDAHCVAVGDVLALRFGKGADRASSTLAGRAVPKYGRPCCSCDHPSG